MWFLLAERGGGGSIFHKFLVIGQPNGPLKKTIKTFVPWDAL